MAQWLGFSDFTAVALGSIFCRETKIPQVAWLGQKFKKKKKKKERYKHSTRRLYFSDQEEGKDTYFYTTVHRSTESPYQTN